MRKMIPLFLLLAGCSNSLSSANISESKYTAGQIVYSNLKFYENCEGSITGFEEYKIKNEHYYDVLFYCNNAGHLQVTLSEKYLYVKE